MSMPTSRDEPAVTIENLARNVPRVSKFEGKSKLRGKVNVEGNISPRAILTKDGVKKVDVKTASALLELGSIIDLGKGVFLDADIAASAFGGKVGDEFRYGDIGLDEVGIGIGKKIGDSGQLGLKGTYRPGRGGQEDDYAVGLSYDRKFNKGGVVDMRQMEMFNIGGLKDEGGSRDSVSGNDVPSGSLKEEVRDDIDAKLSPGEFVFPADVVRYIGLEKLMLMRDKAKKGLKRMEEMGQMGNSEEATLDDDVPFEQSDLLIVAGSPMEEQMNTLNRGGMPIRASNGAFATYGPSGAPTYSTTAPGSSLGGGRGDQLLGSNLQQYFNPTTNEVRSVLVSRDNLTGELKPVSPLPEGFIRDTPENRNLAMQPTTTSASVETTRVDPDILNRASDIGNVRGAPDPSAAGGYQTGATLADMANNPNPNAMSFDQMANYGDTLSGKTYGDKFGGFVGKVSKGLAAATRLGFTDLEVAGQKNSIALSNMRKNDEKAYAELQATFDNNLGKNVDKAKDALVDRFSDVMSVRDIEATAKRAYGVTNAQVLAHLSNVSNGNAPVGSQANAIGGYSTTGTQGHTTNANGEVIGKDATEMLSDFEKYGITPTEDDLVDFNNGKVNQSMRDRRDKAKRDRETEIEKQEKFAFSMSDEPEGAPDVSTPDTPGTEAQAQDPAETGIAEQEEADDAAAAAAEAAGAFKGGFIPKRKKQKKKMKRGGLASRK